MAIGVAVAAVLLRLALDPLWGIRFPYITLFPAIMLSAWLGGLWPGIVTTAVCGTAAVYLWTEPAGSWAVADKSEWLGVLLFVVIGLVISALNEAWRRGAAAVTESEERLRVMLASIGDAVIATDDEGRVIRLNAVAEGLTGWTEADAIGRRLEDVFVIINEETRQPVESPVGKVLREGTIVGLANHTLLISKNGQEVPVDDSAAPIKTADGYVAGVVMVFRDVTERRRSERDRAVMDEAERLARIQAEEAEHRLRFALQAGGMGTWQWTIPTGKITWGPGLEAIHGLQPGAFPGTFEAFQEEIHPEDRTRVQHAIRESLEQGRDHHIEYRIVRSDGAVRWVEGRGQLFTDPDGQPDRMAGVCSDITERKRGEEALKDADRRKDDFLATLSHELRTPLNAMLGWSHMLQSGSLSPDMRERALESLERNARMQAQLVEDLLDVSRITSGKLQIKAESVDLGRVVTAAVDTIRPTAAARRVSVQLSLDPEMEILVTGDADRLQQVVWNLLSNAVKFTPAGGRVDVELRCADSEAEIVVTDTGQGIEPGLLPHVFERFRQGDDTAARAHRGLGLGLAIVRHLTEAHGGTVSADSQGVGQGATFVVRLPTRAVNARRAREPLPVDAGYSAVLPGARVLVIDDEADARDLLTAVLEPCGADVTAVASAGEALYALERDAFDVLLADIGMPKEDGYSLIRAIRCLPADRGGQIPAVAVTAYASVRERDHALKAGYNWHLAKPIETDQLVAIVGGAINRGQTT